MLVRDDGLVIGQPAHAWVSGQLARAWGNPEFPAPVPREPFCLAAEQHDVGWVDADLAPVAGPDGRPLSFMQQLRSAHVAIWRGAARRLLAQSRYAALLVSLHGTSLYEHVDADAEPPAVAAEVRAYLAGERGLQSRLAAGLDPAEVDRNRRLLLSLDRLSLMLCHGRSTTLEGVPAARGPATIRVQPAGEESPRAAEPPASSARDDRAVAPDAPTARFAVAPWPFSAPVVFAGCEARLLEGSFAEGEDLTAALAAAPWVPLRWELSPG